MDQLRRTFVSEDGDTRRSFIGGEQCGLEDGSIIEIRVEDEVCWESYGFSNRMECNVVI